MATQTHDIRRRQALAWLDGVSYDPSGDFWRGRRSETIVLASRPPRVLCLICGADLVDLRDNSGRACPTHGRQLHYKTVAPDGTEYPADPRVGRIAGQGRCGRPAHPEAIEMLRDGKEVRVVAYQTGVRRPTLERWLAEIRRGER